MPRFDLDSSPPQGPTQRLDMSRVVQEARVLEAQCAQLLQELSPPGPDPYDRDTES